MERLSWDKYFIEIAKLVASRSTCSRAAVGAVIVKDRKIVATGYNGSLAGEPHCLEVGCLMENGHCVRTVHAETNAIAQAARFGTPVEGATLYLWGYYRTGLAGAPTGKPVKNCLRCEQLLKAAGIVKIISVEDIRP